MQIRYSPHPSDYALLDTDQLREAFLIESLFNPGRIDLCHTDADRAVVGSAMPGSIPLLLTAPPELRADYFCDRREIGALNIGGPGSINVDGEKIELGKLDCIYVGRGTREISFESKDLDNPSAFYLISYPAHASLPIDVLRRPQMTPVEIGVAADANRRSIFKCIHDGGLKSCQLVMGFTQIQEGSVWNTMPPHTHTRRSEIYCYFDMGPKRRVMHFMGNPQNTRHLVVSDRQAVISPGWSIHCGCGTGSYSFCWGMGGENQAYDDMDPAPLDSLR